jgi:hypothetical protein
VANLPASIACLHFSITKSPRQFEPRTASRTASLLACDKHLANDSIAQMSLVQIYERFFASPNPLSLAEDASLHYIPTLKSFSQQGPVVRHLESQNKNEVKVKSSKRISVVEGSSSIALETETVLEFISSGGTYLPGLDTFIIDLVATLPMVSCQRSYLLT